MGPMERKRNEIHVGFDQSELLAQSINLTNSELLNMVRHLSPLCIARIRKHKLAQSQGLNFEFPIPDNQNIIV